jgi:CrcB protein
VRELLLVGAGGFCGACSRYLVTTAVLRATSASPVPLATLAVNLVGCLAIGFFVGLADARSMLHGGPRLFVVVGFLGGFTTYSSFGLEAFELLRKGAFGATVAYVLLHLVVGVTAVAGGYAAGRALPGGS